MPVSRFQFRRATSSAWTSANPTLAAGELGYELDTKKFKIGDGTTSWTSLNYFASGIEEAVAPITFNSETNSVALSYGTGLTTSSGTLVVGTISAASVSGTAVVQSEVDTANTVSKIVKRDAGGTIAVSAVNASGTISGSYISSSGSIAATGTISGAHLVSSGSISTSTGTISGAHVVSSGSIAATGTISGAALSVTGTVSAAALGSSVLSSTTPGTLSAAGTAGTLSTVSRSDHQHAVTGLALSTDPSFVANFAKSGALTTGTGVFRWYNRTGKTLTIKDVYAAVNTAPTGTTLITDINVDGTTIYGTQANRPTISTAAFTALGGSKSVTTLGTASYITVDIDQIGSTVAGSDLVVSVWLSYA